MKSVIINCTICSKPINLEPHVPKDGVERISYRDPINLDIGRIVTLCSGICKDVFTNDHDVPQGCTKCGSVCTDDTWYIQALFVNQGNYTISKAVCSEKCRNELSDELSKAGIL